MTAIEDEKVQPCWICGKIWRRSDSNEWSYFTGILVCNSHPGVKKWYDGAFKMSNEKMKREKE
jgi:hypothetical protein